MKLRKITIETPLLPSPLTLDFRSNKTVQDLTPIIGLNSSGKSLLLSSIGHLWYKSLYGPKARSLLSPEFKGKITAEFDAGNLISSGIVIDGVVTQKVVSPFFKSGDKELSEGLLLYSSESRSVTNAKLSRKYGAFGASMMRQVLFDLYNGDIRNSVILLDDIDLGLDDSSCRDFFQVLIRKVLEKGNQLIVTAKKDSYFGIAPTNIRRLSSPLVSALDTTLKSLS